MLSKNDRILITGGSGFLGKHVVSALKKKGYSKLFIPRSKDFDLRKPSSCYKLAKQSDIVIHLAANVGGIGYNQNYPATLLYDNLIMGLHMLHESFKAKVKKIVILGTVCAYPKYTQVPFAEESLWDGYPEETNAPYGLAKKMLLVGSKAYRKQHNLNSIYLLPVNLYGPGDTFEDHKSHVIPALIKKFYLAKVKKEKIVTVWGTGNASREFLYVEDAAEGIILATQKYNDDAPINLGSGQEITIYDLSNLIASIIKFKGSIVFDKSKPDGQPRRLLNTQKAYNLFGFRAKTSLPRGLKKTIEWYIRKYGKSLR